MFPYRSAPSKVRKIELRFAASNLVNKDLFSLSDPFLVCHTVRDGRHHVEIGRTETVQDDLNPVWATTFSFDYDPAVHARTVLVVDLFDRDSPTERSLAKHDFLGRAFFTLSHLLDAPAMHLNLPLKPASTLLPTSTSSSSSVTDDETTSPPQNHNQPQQIKPSHRFHTKQPRQKDLDLEFGNTDTDSESQHHYAHEHNNFSSDPLLANASAQQQPNLYQGVLAKKLSSFHRDKHHPSKTLQNTSSNNSADGSGSGSGSGASSSPVLPTPRKTRSRTMTTSSVSFLPSSSSSNDLIRATSGSRAERVSGTVDIYAEELRFAKTSFDFSASTSLQQQHLSPGRVLLRVRSASLKVAGGMRGFRSVTQFYELQRERVCGAWNCVYRSADAALQDRDHYVVFDDVVIDEQTMNNLQGDRKLRLAFYQRHTKKPHTLISYVTTTLSNIRRATGAANNFQTLSLKMEGEFKDDDGLGNVLISRIRFGNNRGSGSASGEGRSMEERASGTPVKNAAARRHLLGDSDDRSGGGGGGVGDTYGNGIVDGEVEAEAEADGDGVRDMLFNKHAGPDSILNEDELTEYRMRTASVTATDGDVRRHGSVGGSDAGVAVEENRNMALELRADHFLNKKFTSSLNDASSKYERRLLQKPAFISLH